MTARSYHGNARSVPELRWYSVRRSFWALLFIALFVLVVFGGF